MPPADPPDRAPAGPPEPVAGGSSSDGRDGAARGALVDWHRTGRRVLRSAAVLAGLAVLAWIVVGVATGGPRPARLGDFLGAAVAGMLVVEVVVVGGSALRGMLRAGERGERLAGGDVSLLPPQLRDD